MKRPTWASARGEERVGVAQRAQLHPVSGLLLLVVGAAGAPAGLPALAPEQLPLQQLHQHVEPGPQIIPPPCTAMIASQEHSHGHKKSASLHTHDCIMKTLMWAPGEHRDTRDKAGTDDTDKGKHSTGARFDHAGMPLDRMTNKVSDGSITDVLQA